MTLVQRQYSPVFMNAKKDLTVLGKIYNYSYEYNLNFAEMTTGWRSTFECAGGGVLIDMGYHILDIVMSFFGNPSSVSASFSYCYDEMEVRQLEDSANLLLKHNNQIHGMIGLNRHHSQKKEKFEIVGQYGTMVITPKAYSILDRKNRIIREFVSDDLSQTKRLMFEPYLQQLNQKDWVKKHFKHHTDIVRLIENCYCVSRKKQNGTSI